MSDKQKAYRKVVEQFLDGKVKREALYAADPYRIPGETLAQRASENHFKRVRTESARNSKDK